MMLSKKPESGKALAKIGLPALHFVGTAGNIETIA